MSVLRLFILVFVLVASLAHSEEVQHSRGESKKLAEASGVKEETGQEVTQAVGAVSEDQVPEEFEGGEDEKEKSSDCYWCSSSRRRR